MNLRKLYSMFRWRSKLVLSLIIAVVAVCGAESWIYYTGSRNFQLASIVFSRNCQIKFGRDTAYWIDDGNAEFFCRSNFDWCRRGKIRSIRVGAFSEKQLDLFKLIKELDAIGSLPDDVLVTRASAIKFDNEDNESFVRSRVRIVMEQQGTNNEGAAKPVSHDPNLGQ